MPQTLLDGLQNATSRIESCQTLYKNAFEWSNKSSERIVDLSEAPFFSKVIEHFGPCLASETASVELGKIFTAAWHVKSHSLIIANQGVTLFCRSPLKALPYITRHIACCVYHPELGVEAVNVGLVGNIYSDDVILRAESACPPSFIFGSQRCNCSYQWASIRELAAHLNPVEPPQNLSGEIFEEWVQLQFTHESGKHLPTREGQGLILMHLDSQSGMGSGYTANEFVLDLYSRALMRQLGENTTEQVFHTSIKEGYESIGVHADARKQGNEAGYQIPAIILDWLQASRSLIVLSNNHFKLKQLAAHGFAVKRVKSLGKIDSAGQREAKQRGQDFAHLDMDGEAISFEEEIQRLQKVFSKVPA